MFYGLVRVPARAEAGALRPENLALVSPRLAEFALIPSAGLSVGSRMRGDGRRCAR